MRHLLKTFTAFITLPLIVGLTACGGGGGSAQAQTPGVTPPVTPVAGKCAAGAWKVVSGFPEEQTVRYETEHFAFRWKGDDVRLDDAKVAGQEFELIWTTFMGKVAFPEPFCDTADKHKANINIDPTFGLSGGPTGDRDMGMWIGPLALKDHWGMSHEFAHALQGSTRGFRDGKYVGWIWESHANWMAHQMDEYHRTEVHCSEMLVNYPHLYYGSTRDRYCNWQFFEFIKDRFGYAAINDIWSNALKPTQAGYLDEDPLSVLARNQAWSADELNDAFGEWALSNVNWDYTDPDGHDEGLLYLTKYGAMDQRDGDRALRVTPLEPIDLAQRRFTVPQDWAPQRWGYNIVQLVPDAGATKIDVKFEGVVQTASATATLPGLVNDPASVGTPDSDWRWGVVAIDATGHSRTSPLVGGPDGEMIFPLKAGDKAVYMVVVGTPSKLQKIQWDQAYYSIYRYPWMVQLTGAQPQGFEVGAPDPVAGGHRHSNGGGWVAAGAHVDATAWVGPYARVLGGSVKGHARIEDHAIVIKGTVQDNAVVGAMSVIDAGVVVRDNAVVATIFKGPGAFEPGTVIGGAAQVRGDAEVRGGPTLTRGVYYGFIDADSAKDPKQGADLTAPVPEVTAKPAYIWRP